MPQFSQGKEGGGKVALQGSLSTLQGEKADGEGKEGAREGGREGRRDRGEICQHFLHSLRPSHTACLSITHKPPSPEKFPWMSEALCTGHSSQLV